MGRKWITKNTDLSNTNIIIKKIVRLPMHNKLSLKDADYISEKVKEYFKVNWSDQKLFFQQYSFFLGLKDSLIFD